MADWIRSVDPSAKCAYGSGVTGFDLQKRLERPIEAEASKPHWKKRVDSLRCLKGVDVMTAADIVFETGEFARLGNARAFAAWLGPVPSEHSSGKRIAQGGITKNRQQAPEKGDGGSGLALQPLLRAFQGPLRRPGSRPCRDEARRQGRAPAG